MKREVWAREDWKEEPLRRIVFQKMESGLVDQLSSWQLCSNDIEIWKIRKMHYEFEVKQEDNLYIFLNISNKLSFVSHIKIDLSARKPRLWDTIYIMETTYPIV